MILTTTPTVEGHRIRTYHGIVSGETIIATNFIKDYFARLTDYWGGKSWSYNKALTKGRDNTLKILEANGAEMGANAIVGIHFDYEPMGENDTLLMVTAVGTAVTVE